MERSLLKLECLKLVKTHLGPKEAIAQAQEFLDFCEGKELSVPIQDVGNSIPLPKVIEPNDGVKEHKNNSKK